MAAAGLVVVRQDIDGEPLEVPVQFLRPLVGAAGIAGGDEAEAREAIDVLLAFDDEDRIIGRVRPQFEQPIGHLADALNLPGPASLAVWTALTEVLRLVPHNLESRSSGFVAVIVGGEDPPPLLWLALRLDRNAEFRDEPFGRLAVGQPRVLPDEVNGAAANLVLMVVPLAALVAGDLDGKGSVVAVAQLSARRQRAVRLAEQGARHVLDPLIEPSVVISAKEGTLGPLTAPIGFTSLRSIENHQPFLGASDGGVEPTGAIFCCPEPSPSSKTMTLGHAEPWLLWQVMA